MDRRVEEGKGDYCYLRRWAPGCCTAKTILRTQFSTIQMYDYEHSANSKQDNNWLNLKLWILNDKSWGATRSLKELTALVKKKSRGPHHWAQGQEGGCARGQGVINKLQIEPNGREQYSRRWSVHIFGLNVNEGMRHGLGGTALLWRRSMNESPS